jgi:hypothetical protein
VLNANTREDSEAYATSDSMKQHPYMTTYSVRQKVHGSSLLCLVVSRAAVDGHTRMAATAALALALPTTEEGQQTGRLYTV